MLLFVGWGGGLLLWEGREAGVGCESTCGAGAALHDAAVSGKQQSTARSHAETLPLPCPPSAGSGSGLGFCRGYSFNMGDLTTCGEAGWRGGAAGGAAAAPAAGNSRSTALTAAHVVPSEPLPTPHPIHHCTMPSVALHTLPHAPAPHPWPLSCPPPCAGDVLLNYLEAYDSIPWDDLRYMFGEVFYGGHITDGMDRRACTTYLQVSGGGARTQQGCWLWLRVAIAPAPPCHAHHARPLGCC